MLKGSVFAQSIIQNDESLKLVLKNICHVATSILSNHPLYRYFEKYLGGYLIIMDPDGTIMTPDDDEALTLSQVIGYIHPLDRELYYENALIKAQSLLNSNYISSYETISEEAGAVKTNEGVIFSYSGFEFLEIEEKKDSDDYQDIFELMNLYTLLTHDFFGAEKLFKVDPDRHSFGDKKDTKYNPIREEILFSLTNDELIDVATKINRKGYQYNFGLLNEVFILKVLLETGFIKTGFADGIVKISNNRFITDGIFN